jgi:DNA-binding transcriptional LysR family regulator
MVFPILMVYSDWRLARLAGNLGLVPEPHGYFDGYFDRMDTVVRGFVCCTFAGGHMINLSFDLLEEFIVLARRLNFSSAARELCMTQSCLSKHIMEIEKQTGIKLITRGYHIALTPAGKAFLRDMTAVIYDFKQSVAKCKEIQAQKICKLRLHEYEVWTTPAQILYTLSQCFKKECPSVVIDYVIAGHRSPIEALQDNRLDCAIVLHGATTEGVVDNYADQGFRAIRLATEQVVLWVDKNHSLLHRETLGVKDLSSIPIITSSGRRHDPMQSAITEMCQNAGFQPSFDNNNVNSITDFFMIETDSRCVFILTPQTINDIRVTERKDMTYRMLEGAESALSSYIVAHKSTENSLIMDFMDYIEQMIGKHDVEALLSLEGAC